MTNYQLQGALRMTEGVRWYEWVGKTSLGETVRAQTRGMVRSPFHGLAITDQRVLPYVKKAP
jgi:hypothetical protein